MWRHDVRQALRLFRREPGFSAAVVLTLTLGIGVNTALYALVEAVLLRPLPFDAADELVVLRHRDVHSGLTKPDVAIGDFVDLRARQRSFESLAGFTGFHSTLLGSGEPLRVEGAAVTYDALRTLRVEPASGRLLREDDALRHDAPVVLVSYEFWRSHLGSDPRVLTRSIQLGDTRRLVVGVLPAGFRMPGMPKTDVVVPLSVPNAAPAPRKAGWIYAFGRLRAGETVVRAEADLAALSRQFEIEFPDQNRGSRYEALRLRDAMVGETRRPLLLLMVAVGFVLLIACANVGNLLLARALTRERDVALRRALGASRSRLVVQVFTEGVVLAVAGGLTGVAVAWRAAPVLASLLPTASFAGVDPVRIDARVLAFAVAVSITSALIFSAIACIGLARAGLRGLPGERSGTMAPATRLAASGLVALEIALAVVLITGAGVTLRSLRNLLAVDPGFAPSGVLTLQLSLPEGRYRDDDARRAFYARAFAEIAELKDVDAVGAAMVTPLTGNNWTVPLQRADRPMPPGQRPPEVGWQLASEGYFQALRIPLRRGRLFDARDAAGAPVVIISESVAVRFFAGEDPVGLRIRLGDIEAEIAGVVGDIRRASLADDPRADLYFPFERVLSPSTTVFVRASGSAMAVLPALRAVVRRIEPHALIYDTRTLSEIAGESAALTRLATRLLSGFALIALLLAVVGVYSLMSYRVRRRWRELGTRLALGASPFHLVRLVVLDAAAIATVGLMTGLIAALVFSRTLSSLLFGVTPWDPATLASAVALLAAATLVGSYWPARRAGRIDPVLVLGSE